MPERRDVLERECIAYCRYFTRQTPGSYVIEKYCEAHEQKDLLLEGFVDPFLWKLTHRSFLLRLIDAFTLVFVKHSVLRKKWLLLIGILESSEPTAVFFDRPDPATRPVLIATMIFNGMLFICFVVFSAILLGPPTFVLRICERLFHRKDD